MRVGIVGAGVVGGRVAAALVRDDEIERIIVVDRRAGPALAHRFDRVGESNALPPDLDVVVIASRWGSQARLAHEAILGGADVVAVSDSIEDVGALLDLDAEARERDRLVVVGAGFCPGLTGVLARHGAAEFDSVDEIHIATVGTAGPWCARQHHRALGDRALDYRDGGWVPHPGGSGRDLFWFPDPIGGADCYRAALPDPMLLVPVFPDIRRVTARMAATRRDRLTARLPMLRRPHPEGLVGAVRVELRGWRNGAREVAVFGASAVPGDAAAVVAATIARRIGTAPTHVGAVPLATVVDPADFLGRLAAAGLTTERFVGAA